jgi:mRNA interferase RelE/StbE
LAWTVSIDPRALREVEKLDRTLQRRVMAFLQQRIQLQDNPRSLGKPLKGEKQGLWRYRVGDYRIVCQLDDKASSILVLRVVHRKDAYR